MLPPPNLIDPTLAPEKDPVRPPGPAGTGGGDGDENEEEDEEEASAAGGEPAPPLLARPLLPLLVRPTPPALAVTLPLPPPLPPFLVPAEALLPTIGVPKLDPKLLPPGPPFRAEPPPLAIRIRGISSRSLSPGICWTSD